MPIEPVMLWHVSDIVSAVILLGAIVLMAKFYEEYLDVGIADMDDWKLITIGFAFYIAIKTHFTVIDSFLGRSLVAGEAVVSYPWYVVTILSVTLLTSSSLVFIGFYGLVKDYL